MGLLRLGKLPTGDQLLTGKLADGLEHGEARLVPRIGIERLLEANQTGIVECIEAIKDRERWTSSEARHCFRRIERPAAGEHRQAAEERLLRGIEEVMTPGYSPAQCLLSLWEVPATSGEEREPAVETRQDRFRWEESHARRRQLDGEREAVQATADGNNRFRVVFGQLEAVLYRASAIDEEANRLRG